MQLDDLPVDIRREVQALGQANLAPEARPLSATPGDVKAQGIRLGDILLFGPLMIYSGLGRNPPEWMKAAMLVIGVGTIFYNAMNFVEIERRKSLQQ